MTAFAKPNPSSTDLASEIRIIHRDLNQLTNSVSSTGHHYVAILTICITFFSVVATLLLLWRQSLTLNSQTEITKRLVEIEHERDRQENYISSYLSVSVNESKFVTSTTGGVVPYRDAFRYVLYFVNNSELPIFTNAVNLRFEIFSDSEVLVPGVDDHDALNSEGSMNVTSSEHRNLILMFGVVPPRSSISYELDPEPLVQDSKFRAFVFSTVQDAYQFAGIEDATFQIFHSFKNAKGEISLIKNVGGLASSPDPDAYQMYEFPADAQRMLGRWIPREE